MPTMIIRARIKPGREDEFIAMQQQLMLDVAANEPGAEAFQVRQAEDDPRTYVWFMAFKDDESFQRYADADYHQKMSGRAMDCIEGEPVVETLVDFR